MKKLLIPENQYLVTDTFTIQPKLHKLWQKRKKDWPKLHRITLYGVFKAIRGLKEYSMVGDYPILAECVDFLQKNNMSPSNQEISRCLKYFEDYDAFKRNWNKQIVKSLES